MSKYLTPEIEDNKLGLKLKSRPDFEEKKQTESTSSPQKKTPSSQTKPTKKTSTLRQWIDFVLLSGIIFSITFLVMNFSAYKAIVYNFLFPENQIEQAQSLTETIGTNPQKQTLLELDPNKKVVQKTFPPLNLQIAPPDNRIVIPKIAKNVPLVEMDTSNLVGENWSELEEQIQEGLRNGVVHYPGTALPGQYGNVFVTGHSSYYPWDKGLYKDVFALLPKMKIGDEYYIFYNQKKYTYRILEKKEVYPNNVDVLQQPGQEKISTLMTCVPVGTSLRRLILIAKEV